jgi:hypothetical protein
MRSEASSTSSGIAMASDSLVAAIQGAYITILHQSELEVTHDKVALAPLPLLPVGGH